MSISNGSLLFPWTGRSQRWFSLAYGGWQFVTVGVAGSGLAMLGLMAGSGGIGKKEQPIARLMLIMAILSAVLAALGWAYTRLLSRNAGGSRSFFAGFGILWLAIVPAIAVSACTLGLRGVELPSFSSSPPQAYHVTVYRNGSAVGSYDETQTDQGPVVMGLMVLGYGLLVGWSWVMLGVVPFAHAFKSAENAAPTPLSRGNGSGTEP